MVRRPTSRTHRRTMAVRRDGRRHRHRRLHEPRAGARTAGRQAHRHLGLRLRPLRDVDRARGVCGRHGLGLDREDSRARAGLVGAARRDTRADSTAPAPLPGEGSEAAPERHRRRPDRDRRDRRSAAGRAATPVPLRSCQESRDVAAVGRARGARRGGRHVGGPTPGNDGSGEPARQRHVLARHELGGHGRAGRNLARRQVRGLPRRQGWTTRCLGESSGHRDSSTTSRSTSRRC